MTGILRFIGLANAAVWLGGAILYAFGFAPALVSKDILKLLGPNNFPFYSGAIAQVALTRYFQLQLICATVALLHWVVEWLYLGRAPRRFWTYLLVALFCVSVVGSFWLGPKLGELHRTHYKLDATPAQREVAAKSFRVWQAVFQGLNVLVIAGVAVYLWRAANPPDELRFVGSAKIRG